MCDAHQDERARAIDNPFKMRRSAGNGIEVAETVLAR
jgi:hypothetical protein